MFEEKTDQGAVLMQYSWVEYVWASKSLRDIEALNHLAWKWLEDSKSKIAEHSGSGKMFTQQAYIKIMYKVMLHQKSA